MYRYVLVPVLAVLILGTALADDALVPVALHDDIQATTLDHITDAQVDGRYLVYDAALGRLYELKLKDLRKDISKEGDYYIAGGDFTDDAGAAYKVDFLITSRDGRFQVYQAVIRNTDSNQQASVSVP